MKVKIDGENYLNEIYEYPKLMIREDDNEIVLCLNKDKGISLYDPAKINDQCEEITDMNMNLYKPFNGKVILEND
jgi:hypothetical protein